jgi:hypothetical protein
MSLQSNYIDSLALSLSIFFFPCLFLSFSFSLSLFLSLSLFSHPLRHPSAVVDSFHFGRKTAAQIGREHIFLSLLPGQRYFGFWPSAAPAELRDVFRPHLTQPFHINCLGPTIVPHTQFKTKSLLLSVCSAPPPLFSWFRCDFWRVGHRNIFSLFYVPAAAQFSDLLDQVARSIFCRL